MLSPTFFNFNNFVKNCKENESASLQKGRDVAL